MQEAQYRGADVLSVAQQMWRTGVSDARKPKYLKLENARLKRIVPEQMLAREGLKEYSGTK